VLGSREPGRTRVVNLQTALPASQRDVAVVCCRELGKVPAHLMARWLSQGRGRQQANF